MDMRRMSMRKACVALVVLFLFSGCAEDEGASGQICVVSREEGSGTRNAFVELFEIEEKDAEGNGIDMITVDANTTNSTAVMMMTVASDINAIGYVSLGSLNDSVKAIEIDGASPSVENIKNGAYKISRPFNVVIKDDLNPVASDFIAFIMSADGQAVVEECGYIPVDNTGEYEPKHLSGAISVAGSSSVTPVMEKLKEAYIEKNPDIRIDVQQNDSTTGVNSTVGGICDIGMASRGLRVSESDKGIREITIAMDGIAVIVNNDAEFMSLTSEQVKNIFIGEITTWPDITGGF